jgi:hypothetical protein
MNRRSTLPGPKPFPYPDSLGADARTRTGNRSITRSVTRMAGVSVAGICDDRAAIAALLVAGRLAFMDRNMDRLSTMGS